MRIELGLQGPLMLLAVRAVSGTLGSENDSATGSARGFHGNVG